MEAKWRADYMNALREKAGLQFESVSAATGIPVASLCAYSSERITPSINTLITLADYFAVPLDFLVGRLPEEKAREVIDNYQQTFMELRKAPYEAYLFGRREMRESPPRKGESPWPYNLLDAVFSERWEEPLSEDQVEGLNYALSTLDVRTQGCIRDYYEHGNTLQDVGDRYGVSRERVRQIITRGCWRLRHPTRATFLKVGMEAASRMIRNNEEEVRLSEIEKTLQEKAEELRIKQDQLEDWGLRLQQVAASHSKMSLYDMALSTRATNILHRRGARTLDDVVTILDTGRFDTFRGVGKQTLSEVAWKVQSITGKDYSAVYDLM